jgi:TolB-like protein
VTSTGYPSPTHIRIRASRTWRFLPFENLSCDPSVEYLAEGIAEAVIHALSQLPAVRVMARNAALRFKHANLDPQTIGRKLNVRAVLVGRSGSARISAARPPRLVQVEGHRAWSVSLTYGRSENFATVGCTSRSKSL